MSLMLGAVQVPPALTAELRVALARLLQRDDVPRYLIVPASRWLAATAKEPPRA